MSTALRSEATTAAAETEYRIERILQLNGTIGAVTDFDFAQARRDAARIDDAVREGKPLGQLAGWPVTIKDSFDVRGTRSTVGRSEDSRIPSTDAAVVRRLREHGAIILGKTNVPVMLDDYQSSNNDFGTTRNPWDLRRTPGGSSGGAAAAVVSGMSVGDLGSDLYGSIRMPAAWCGIFGHRPTNGLISKLGHMPGRPGDLLEPPLSTVGPLAGTAADLRAMFTALVGAGYGAENGYTRTRRGAGWTLELPEPWFRSLGGLRIALWIDDPEAPVDAETRHALAALGDALSDAGCQVTTLAAAPWGGGGTDLLDLLKDIELSHNVGAGWEPAVSVGRAWEAWEEQRSASRAWTKLFDEIDFVIAPVTFGAAPRLSTAPEEDRWIETAGRRQRAMDFHAAWSKLTNIPQAPSTVIPLGSGRDSGLPIGGQIMGPYLADLDTLALAELLSEEGIIAAPQWTGVRGAEVAT